MRRTTAIFASMTMLLGLACFVPSAAAAGYWVCRDGGWVAVGGPAHPRPARACGERPAIPDTEVDCRRAGGRWGRAGLFPKPICVLATSDAGHICGDTGECESLCLADPTPAERARIAARTPVETTGKCGFHRPVFGCMYRVEAGVVRGRLCAD